MDRRIETRVVDTGGAAKTTIIQKDPVDVYWIAISPETVATKGVLKIYDGFDTEGKLEFQIEKEAAQCDNFIPPIPCEQALTVYNDDKIACYTIAYRPRKWGD